MEAIQKNTFYIVATPIGNMSDISQRAKHILSNVDTILCEDTRVTGKLLHHHDIKAEMKSYHAQSSDAKEEAIISKISSGTIFALVSDAGTPGISDPGSHLVARIRADLPDVRIISIPGASALTTAISASGFFGNQFTFFGFLPHKKGRKTIFDEIENSTRMSVFYESPHRLMKTLLELKERFGNKRKICASKELTKLYEESHCAGAGEVHDYFASHPDKVRGEFVIIVDKP